MRKILVLNSSISLTDCEFNPTGEGGLVDIWIISDPGDCLSPINQIITEISTRPPSPASWRNSGTFAQFYMRDIPSYEGPSSLGPFVAGQFVIGSSE